MNFFRNTDAALKAKALKLSSDMKARHLFQREVLLDAQNDDPFLDSDALKAIIQNKEKFISERDKLLKSGSFCLSLAIALAFGLSVSISQISIDENVRPLIIGVFTCITALSILQIIICLANENLYQALIDNVIIEKAKSSRIDPDVMAAAFQPIHLIFKATRTPFNLYEQDSIRTSAFGSRAYSIAIWFVLQIWFLTFWMIFGVVAWLAIFHFPPGYLGWIMRVFAFSAIAAGLVVHLVQQVEFSATDDFASDSLTQRQESV